MPVPIYIFVCNIYFYLFEALGMEPRAFGMEGKHLLLSAHPPQPSDMTGWPRLLMSLLSQPGLHHIPAMTGS